MWKKPTSTNLQEKDRSNIKWAKNKSNHLFYFLRVRKYFSEVSCSLRFTSALTESCACIINSKEKVLPLWV